MKIIRFTSKYSYVSHYTLLEGQTAFIFLTLKI